jgi:hypothetical protein
MNKVKRFFTALLVGALAAIAMLGTTAARAQLPLLDMLVTPSAQTGAPGDSILWNIQLTNNTGDTAFFMLTGFSDGFPITPDVSTSLVDFTPFGVGTTLAPGDSLTLSNLYQADIAPTAADAVYDATAEMNYDLYDDNSFSNFLADGLVASGDWQLTVRGEVAPGATPEPSSLAWFGSSALIGTACFLRRRRRR